MEDIPKKKLNPYIESYFKDSKNCLYKHKIAGISICGWNNSPCERVPYELCPTYTDKEENNTNE